MGWFLCPHPQPFSQHQEKGVLLIFDVAAILFFFGSIFCAVGALLAAPFALLILAVLWRCCV